MLGLSSVRGIMTITNQAMDGLVIAHCGAAVWDAAVQASLQVLAVRPLHEVTLDIIASAIGIPVADVREQIPDLNELLIAVIQYWYADRMARVHANAARDGTIVFLRDLLTISISDPTCTRMVLTAASIAGSPDHPAAGMLQQMWVRFHALVQRALVQDVAAGREPDTMDPANGAEQLLAIYEGLQFQWLFRPHMDLLTAYDRATTRLRHGWSEAYRAPIWDI